MIKNSPTPFALYIHWPFCESKCPYCDFNSHVMRTITESDWVKAIIIEMDRFKALIELQPLSSIFFGGGTPSLMSAEAVATLIDAAKKRWAHTDTLEISMEANPGSVEAARFQGYRDAGVNRLSLGVQALNDDDLKVLGRKHSTEHALKALAIAQNTFDRVSLDLIYARPHQTVDAWAAELKWALSLGTTHMSLYQLTIEPGTAFAPMHARGDLVIPEEHEAYDLYMKTAELTEQHGLFGYETSNYAKPGFECQHNLTYWNYGDYMGVGPGAHGRLVLTGQTPQKVATQQIKAPKLWLDAVNEKGSGDQSITPIDLEAQFQEQLMMGLRLTNGIPLQKLIRPWTAEEEKRLQTLIKEDLLTDPTLNQRLQLTRRGALVLNSVLGYIVGK